MYWRICVKMGLKRMCRSRVLYLSALLNHPPKKADQSIYIADHKNSPLITPIHKGNCTKSTLPNLKISAGKFAIWSENPRAHNTWQTMDCKICSGPVALGPAPWPLGSGLGAGLWAHDPWPCCLMELSLRGGAKVASWSKGCPVEQRLPHGVKAASWSKGCLVE